MKLCVSDKLTANISNLSSNFKINRFTVSAVLVKKSPVSRQFYFSERSNKPAANDQLSSAFFDLSFSP